MVPELEDFLKKGDKKGEKKMMVMIPWPFLHSKKDIGG